jgi:UDP-4-amino-4,6-dideoxy-N-acetyl-beta-L-altrosamine transaminase
MDREEFAQDRDYLMSRIPYGRQHITDEDVAAVVEVLRSEWLTQGPAVPRFEQTVARYCGAAHAVAVNSATSALHVACMALDLGPQDWLWTTPITFVASANCGRFCGANVDFVDIDPVTCNMSVDALADKLVEARLHNRLPKVVVPVHLCGQSCDMEGISRLACEYGFAVIEDGSHAVGGSYQGLPVGSCRYSQITVFSFHPVKIVTTGEGGLALTNDPGLARRMELVRSHGITRDAYRMERTDEGEWYYEQQVLGYNYRMTDLQAALGVSQFARIGTYIAQRRTVAARYDKLLEDLPLKVPGSLSDSRSAHHLYVVRLTSGRPGLRRIVFDAMRAQGIGVNVHYIPVHLQPYYRRFGFTEGQFPEAERYYSEALTLPLFPGLSAVEQDRVVSALRSALES